MKKSLKLMIAIFAVVVFANVTFAQIPSYTLEVKNGVLVDANTFKFDIVFTHTDANVWETAGWQYFFRVDNAFFAGGTVTYGYDSSGGNAVSDLPVAFRPRNPQNVVQGSFRELRLAANSLPGTGNGLIIPQGVPTLIGRMKLTSSNPFDINSGNFIIRDSCESPISLTRTKINIYDQSDLLNKEVTRCANHSVDFNTVLPVELASFTSNVNRNNVTLNWSTAKETNNSGFDIERTLAGTTDWTKVGNVSGNGTTNETKSYSFTERVNTGKYSYRLKQVDFNGNFEYFNLSSEIEVGVPNAYKLSQNYPNPFNPSTKIDYDLPYDGKVSILLYDISGREVASLVNEVKTAGYYTATFNGANLASGMYFYRINATGTGNNNFVTTKKMVLIK
ncbi:MAG: T9SS type A sorting domain-containing protein [Bacteroidetes bacterium]|nr:T9SS type A sorting domain-containing protein [Bacteroidota bacterium]